MVIGRRLFNNNMKKQEKGSIFITLIVIMVILGIMIAAFSSIMISKHLSEPMFVQSIQAFYIAQAGIEWGIRHATDNAANFYSDPNSVFPGTLVKNFENGNFSLIYDSDTQTLLSTGELGIAKRAIILASFSNYLPPGGGLTLIPGTPPYQGTGGNKRILYLPIQNLYDQSVIIFQLDIAKIPQSDIQEIYFESTLVVYGAVIGWKKGAPLYEDITLSIDPNSPTSWQIDPNYEMAPGPLTNSVKCPSKWDVPGTWYVTFHYYLQDDPNTPMSTLFDFDIL